MGLIAEPARQRNLTKRCAGRQHHRLRALHALTRQVSAKRHPEAAPEGDREITGAEPGDRGEIGEPELLVEVGVYVGLDAADLPWREATPIRTWTRGIPRTGRAIAGGLLAGDLLGWDVSDQF